ncbi:hypothetical protein B7463_g7258, partial [Scytalidium lignicola]
MQEKGLIMVQDNAGAYAAKGTLEDLIKSMSKRFGMRCIVIAVDGTAREGQGGIEDEENTNVYRTKICVENNQDPELDSLYLPGVGTTGWSGKRLVDKITGHGTDRQIRKAYEFICEKYTHPDDKIYLIGYSRGAFAIRCVADLVFKIGILSHDDCRSERMNDVFRRWKSGKMNPLTGLNLAPVSNNRVNVCVLWDTVGSVNGPLCRVVDSDVRGADFNFHALALHERRQHYLPTVMRFLAPLPLPLTTAEQCWFNGYHGDIGGGRKKNALGNLALAWALAKLDDDLHPNWDALEVADNNNLQYNWAVDGEELYLDVRDTAKGIFRILPFRDRYPKLQFWNSNTHSTLPVNQETYTLNSQETIHSTVRYLSRYMRREPKVFESANRTEPPGVRWMLYGTDWFHVREAPVSWKGNTELRRWVEKNRRELNGNSRLGQSALRNVIIAELLAYLEDMQLQALIGGAVEA